MQPMMADNEHRNFISRSYRTRQLNDESLTYLSKFCQAGQHAGGVRKNCEAGCAGFLSVAWSEDPDETVKRGGWRSCLSSIRMHQPGAWRLGQATTPSGNLSSSPHPLVQIYPSMHRNPQSPLNQILIVTAYMADVDLCPQLDPNDLP